MKSYSLSVSLSLSLLLFGSSELARDKVHYEVSIKELFVCQHDAEIILENEAKYLKSYHGCVIYHIQVHIVQHVAIYPLDVSFRS